MPRTRSLLHGSCGLLGVLALSLSGCVDRRFIVTTDPPGAIVHVNNQPIGAAPADAQFTHYGKYRFSIVRDGYQTLHVDEQIRTPWYQWLGLDFISENLIPWTFHDEHRLHYTLQPLPIVPPETVLQRAEEQRARGQTIGAPVGVPLGVPTVPAPMLGPATAPVNPAAR